MSWTDDRVDILKKLWAEGLSAGQVARQLGGGTTRNAVIGKVHRMGLDGREIPSAPSGVGQKKATAPPKTTAPMRTVGPPPVYEPAPDGGVTIFGLTLRSCRWIIGGGGIEAKYCGAETEKTYCPHHAAIAYQPVQSASGKRAAVRGAMWAARQ